MTTSFRIVAMALSLSLSVVALPARAAGGGGGGGGGDIATQSPDRLKDALAAIDAQRWDAAIGLLRTATARASNDADAYNWLGYAYRKSGRLPEAFTAYRRALVLDPRHLGVHEYLGEAYLQNNEPAKAEEHLARLAALCNSRCEQYTDLKKSLEDYRARTARP